MLNSPHATRFGALAGLGALLVTLLPALALVSPAEAAPGAGDPWTATSQRPQASHDGHVRTVNPATYRAYTLDDGAMAVLLRRAPMEDAASGTEVVVPAPTGEPITFDVVESPVMESGLAAAHPEITTYAGTSVTDGFEGTIRLDRTPLGFHASVISGQKSWYVDPAYVGDTSLYLSYFGDALPTPERGLVEPELDQATRAAIVRDQKRIGEGAGGAVVRRDYRLALVTDPTYATYFAPGADDATSNSLVLAAKTTLMNRVNQIYNDDFAVRMLMVNGTDLLNFNTTAEATGANGPCGASACYTAAQLATCDVPTIDRNDQVVGQLIGAANYDIGHIGLGVDGGGIAYLGVVGMDLKGGGCTGLPTPTGDFYAIDYVAHEMGHQFNGATTRSTDRPARAPATARPRLRSNPAPARR